MTLRSRRGFAILLVLLMSISIVAISTLFTTTANNNKAYAAYNGDDVNLTYAVYDFEEYSANIKFDNYFEDDLAEWMDYAQTGKGSNKKWTETEYANSVWDGTDPDGDVLYAKGDPTKTCYEYYGDYPQNLCTFNTLTGDYSNLPTALGRISEKTEFSAGEYMMIMVYLESSDGLMTCDLSLNLGKTGTNALGLTDATSFQSTTLPTSDPTTIYAYTNTNVWTETAGVDTTRTYPNITGMVDIEATPAGATTKVLAGYFAFQVGSSAASGSISACGLGNSTGATSYVQTVACTGTNVAEIHETAKSLTIAASNNSQAEVTASGVTINGNTPTTGTTQTIDGVARDVFACPTALAISTSTVTLHIVPTYGNVASVKYYVGENCPTTASGFTFSGSSSGNNYTYTPSTWNPNTTVYALATVKSADNTTTEYYVLTAPKDKYDIKELTGLVINGDGDVCDLYNQADSAAATFASGTFNYTLRVSKNTHTISFTPTVDTTKGETIKVNGVAATSGSPSNVSVTTSTTSISIDVKSQKGNTQSYTFTLNWLSDVVTLTSVNVKVDSNAAKAATYNSTGQSYSLSGSTNVPYGSSVFTFNAVPTESAATIEYSIDGTNYSATTSGSYVPSTGVSFGSGNAEVEKTVYIRVTAPDGVTKQVYPLAVKRYGGDTNSTLSSAAYKTRVGSSYDSAQNIGFTSAGTNAYTATVSGIPFKKEAVAVKVSPTLGTVSNMAYTYTVDGSGGSSGPLSTNTFSNDLGFGSSINAVTIVVTITVTAQNTANEHKSTYTITFTREAAETDNNATIKVYNNSGTQIAGTWTGDVFNPTESLDYTVTSVRVNAVFSAKASGSAADGTDTYALTTAVNSSPFNYSGTATVNKVITVTITSEAGVARPYTLNLTRKAADDTPDYTLVIQNSNGATLSYTLDGASYPQTNTVNNTFAYTETTFVVTITPAKTTTSVAYGSTIITGAYTININQSNHLAHSKTESFVLTTQAGNTYTVKITYNRAAGDTDASISATSVQGYAHGTLYPGSWSAKTYTAPDYKCSYDGNDYYLGISATSANAKIYYSTAIPTSADDTVLVPYTGTAGDATFAVGTPLYITVVPQVKSFYSVYTINVTALDDRNTEKGISNITITGLPSTVVFTFAEATDLYGTYTVPYSVKSVTIEVTMKHATEKVKKFGVSPYTSAGAVGAGLKYTNTVNLSSGTTNEIHVQAESESEAAGTDYVIKIERLTAITDNFLTSLTINGQSVTYNQTDSQIDFCVLRTLNAAAVAFTVSTNAVYELTDMDDYAMVNNSLSYNKTLYPAQANTITIKVVSEKAHVDNGTSAAGRLYTIKIYRAEQGFSATNIALYSDSAATTPLVTDPSYTFSASQTSYPNLGGTYSNLPGVIAVVQKGSDSSNAVVTGDITYRTLTAGTPETLTITIKSEYASLNSNITNQQATYTYTITRANASTVNTLDALWVIVENAGVSSNITITEPQAFNKTVNGTYLVGNITGSTVTLGYTLTDPTHSKVDSTSNLTTTLTATNTTEQLTVKVLDELGNPNTYIVKVSSENLVLDSNNAITSINVNSDGSHNLITYNAADDEYEIEVRYPISSLNVSAVTAVTTSTLKIQGVQVASGTIKSVPITQGGNTTITVQAFAQDTTAGTEYKIKVKSLAADTDTSLKTFKVAGNTVTNGQTINVPKSTTSVSFIAEPNSDYATISPNDTGNTHKYSLAAKDLDIGSNQITFTVTPEDTTVTPKQYTVTIIRDDDTTLSDLTVWDSADTGHTNLIDFSDPTSYTFTVPYKTQSVDINYVLNAESASNVTVTGAGTQSLTAGQNNPIEVKITAASGASTSYRLNITREAGDPDNFIITYTPEVGDTFAPSGNTITYVLPRSYIGGTFNPTYTISPKATAEIKETARALYLGLNQFTIEVTSETEVKNPYSVKVYVCDSDASIQNIELLDASDRATTFEDLDGNSLTYNKGTLAYGTFNVPNSTSQVFLKVVPTASTSTIYVDGAIFTNSVIHLNGGENTFNIYVKSEYATYNTTATNAQSQTYKITIYRETPNGDATLKTLTAKINGTGADLITNFNPTTETYTITGVENATSITITAEANVAYPKAVVENGTSKSSLNNDLVSYPKALAAPNPTDSTGYNFEHVITVTAEDGTTKQYTIYISRGTLSVDEDNTIVAITVTDSTGAKYLNQQSFNATQETYNITIPYGPQSYSITATVYSLATITGDGQFQINFASSYVNSSGDYYRTHDVYATSQKGVQGTHYTINVKVKKPSEDATLGDLQVNFNTVAGFDPAIERYTIATVANTIDNIHIYAEPADPTATVSGDLGYVDLEEGQNTFVVTVTAQSGAQKNYYINIKRQYGTPYLSDLDVVGEQLLSSVNQKATTFDPNTNTYHVIVKYLTDSVTIDAFVEEESYTVSCSNSTIVSSRGTIREFKANLEVGTNNFTIGVKSSHGMSNTYRLVIQRRDVDSANTNIATLTITAIETKEKLMDQGEYNSLVSTYDYTVPNKVRNLDLHLTVEKIADAMGEGAKYQVFNDKNLDVGENQVVILVTAEDGETTRAVIVNVTREPNDFDVSISGENNTILEGDKALAAFREDFANDTIKQYYEVSTAVNSLDFVVRNRDTSDTANPTFEVVNGSNLKVGDNNVKLLIKAADGSVQDYEIKVKRLPMSFTVNKSAYSYSCSEVQGTTANNYSIDLGNLTVDAIEDYTKYIEFDAAQNLTTEVISQSNSEVVVKVATADNAEVQYVHFLINTTANNGTVFDILFWIILGLAIILLIIILIFVNKDKYGTVSNSRKK